MWVITYKGKPATLEKLYKVERDDIPYPHDDGNSYLVASTKTGATARFIFYFGWSWPERTNGVEVQQVKVA